LIAALFIFDVYEPLYKKLWGGFSIIESSINNSALVI